MENVLSALEKTTTVVKHGKVAEAHGTLIKVTGISACIGDQCKLLDHQTGYAIDAEVVGFAGGYAYLTPLGNLRGISNQMEVIPLGKSAEFCLRGELLGQVLDAQGSPFDTFAVGYSKPAAGDFGKDHSIPIYQEAPNPMSRLPINQVLATGVKAIDSLLTIGVGQRTGIFATAGGGKSTLLGMLAVGAAADVNVIVLIGERGREVREFIDDNLGEAGLRKSVLVVATSDKSPIERCRAAYLGQAIAEYYRDQGKSVLLLMDSITRYARALREVGLALGELPARRGYPPSVFAQLPQLFERAGNNDRGYITGFYTVLIEDENQDDPIGEEVRSLLDGHIILSQQLAAAGHYPAIDVLRSASRLFNRIALEEQLVAAREVRQLLAKFREIELLVQVGEYESGADLVADKAIEKQPVLKEFLTQPHDQRLALATTLQQLVTIVQ
ncbi:MAG: FliI/YscN family ATPase [Pseudomonadales bacterium]|nr:FliI/YscN family ATPase [Pseudomonadales bacterium]